MFENFSEVGLQANKSVSSSPSRLEKRKVNQSKPLLLLFLKKGKLELILERKNYVDTHT